MKKLRSILSVVLALSMVFSCNGMTAFAEEVTEVFAESEIVAEDPADEISESEVAEDAADEIAIEEVETEDSEAETEETETEEIFTLEDDSVEVETYASSGGTLDTSDFYKMVLIDCGRGYYSVDNIKSIIDTMADCDYEYLMLGFGNDGLRFVLDDMSVTAGGTTYASDTVKNAVISANDTLQNNSGNGQWTQAQMDAVITYATSKGISIVPLINSPGHAYSICKAIEACGLGGLNTAFYQYGTSGAVNQYNYSLNLANSYVVAFSEALIQKYIEYFATKGCKFFNFGCDETKNTTNAQVVSYVNDLCSMLPDTMVPMAFCDILKSTSGYPANLVGIDWDGGHLSSSNKHMNANDNWYYVIGNSETADGWSTYYRSLNRTKSIPVTTTLGGETAYGSILAVWNDNYLASDSYIDNIQNLIRSQAEANPAKFTLSETREVTVEVGQTANQTIDGTQTMTEGPDTSIATVATSSQDAQENWSASASTSISAYSGSAADVIDGSTSSYYWSNGAQSKGAYVRVDLGTEQTINAIRVTPADTSSDSTCTADVQVSTDGSTWTTVGTYDGSKATTVAFNETTARYIQVVITTAKSNWWKVAEIEWGTATISTSTTPDTYNATTVSFSSYNYSNYVGYYYKSGNNYYVITGIKRNSTSSYTISYNGTSTDVGRNNTLYTKSAGTTTTTVTGFTQNAKTGGSVTGQQTLVEITGVSVGDTTAVVGNTKFNIHVVAEDISSKSLTYYPFLSDYAVYPEGTGASNCSGTEGTGNVQTLAATVSGVNTEDGVDISTVAWATGDWRWEGDAVQTVYWKGVLHNTTETKQIGKQSDQSLSGIDFKYVRYLNGTWAVSADRETWTAVTADDEVCVYYLQETEVTSEVTTYVKDWAFTTNEYSSYGSDSRGHKALSFAVVYPDGQMSPAADSIYSDSTMIYWYNTGVTSDTDTMLIRFGVNDIYEVSKITYTYGKIASESSTSGSLSWEEKTVDETTWYDETTYWDDSMTTEPVVKTNDFLTYNDNKFDASGDAMLILIYLKPVVSEDSLTVQYWDDSSNAEIYNYIVNIENKSTDAEKGTFLNRLTDNGNVIGTSGPWNGATASQANYLPDTAYVVNAAGVNETFQKNLSKIPSLMGKYASGLYTYVKAEVSEDGKTLILHYNLNESKLSKSYVVDFGLPLTISVKDDLGVDNIKSIDVQNGTYGNTTVSGTNVIYTPVKVMLGRDTIRLTVTFNDNKTQGFTVAIYPATTVYYEETFAEGFDGGNVSSQSQQTQATDATGKNVYGYDAAYASNGGASSGDKKTSKTIGNSATFDFKGTGVDIYTDSTADTGIMMVQIKDSNGKTKKLALVDTVKASGTTSQTTYTPATLNGMIAYSVTNLAIDTYTVILRHTTTAAKTDLTADGINLDGFRVYNTMGTDTTAQNIYKNVDEDDPTFHEVRDLALQGITLSTDSEDYAAYTGEQVYKVMTSDTLSDGAIATTALVLGTGTTAAAIEKSTDLIDNGPKNELFLYPGQTLVMNLNTTKLVQVGLRSVEGIPSCTVNGTEVAVSTTDMFYAAKKKGSNGTLTIMNTSTTIISVTKVKVSDEVSFNEITEANIVDALYEMGYEDEKPMADSVQTINLVDYTGTVKASTSVTVNGVEGETATIDAEAIKSAAESVLPSGYAIADPSAIADAEVIYGENGSVSILVGKVATLNITYKKGKKVVGTATLTHVQTSSGSKYTFTTSEIKAAAPAGYRVISLMGTSVKYGSTSKLNATCM